jgi:quercetin 2,3-dioxygenase
MDTTTAVTPMKSLGVRAAQVAYPTGNKAFSVMQPFPAAFSAEEADPFLMLDKFGGVSKGRETDPDKFPVDWHPHRGMDLLSYLKKGTGRHADSMGNREEFRTPGLQWTSAGSGIEHAEGGGTPAGEPQDGFQIWINVPSARKMDDPKYGNEPPESLPLLQDMPASPGVLGRVIAGSYGNAHQGPFKTIQPVQMVDYELQAGSTHVHAVPEGLDNCLVYVYEGSGRVNNEVVPLHSAIRLNATDPNVRTVTLSADSGQPLFAMVLAGKMLRQPVAWHGPFVMTTDEEIEQTIREYRRGTFLKKKASWDYKRIAARPAQKGQQRQEGSEL